jgi:hypothetical protein
VCQLLTGICHAHACVSVDDDQCICSPVPDLDVSLGRVCWNRQRIVGAVGHSGGIVDANVVCNGDRRVGQGSHSNRAAGLSTATAAQ